jgi:hypothetical protein
MVPCIIIQADKITSHNKNNTKHTTKHEYVNNRTDKTKYLPAARTSAHNKTITANLTSKE